MAKTIHMTSRREAERHQILDRDQHWIVVGYVILATLALFALSVYIYNNPLLPYDLEVSRTVQSIKASWYDVALRFVGEAGYPPQVYALVFWIILVLYLTGLKWEAVMQIFATVGLGVVGLVVKMLVDRPRPTPDLVNVMTSLDGGKLSFPAGHVQSFVAIIGFLWFLSFMFSNPWIRTATWLVFGELLALIGYSRIYTGEHWLTDVIGAYLLGSLWLILTIYLYLWGKPRFFKEREKSN